MTMSERLTTHGFVVYPIIKNMKLSKVLTQNSGYQTLYILLWISSIISTSAIISLCFIYLSFLCSTFALGLKQLMACMVCGVTINHSLKRGAFFVFLGGWNAPMFFLFHSLLTSLLLNLITYTGLALHQFLILMSWSWLHSSKWVCPFNDDLQYNQGLKCPHVASIPTLTK